MSPAKERILYLLNAYSRGNAAEAEKQELFAWVNENHNHELIQQHIQKITEQDNSGESVPAVDWEQLYEKVLNKTAIQKPPSVVRRMLWFRWAAAAAVIVLFGAGAYLYLNPPSSKKIITSGTT